MAEEQVRVQTAPAPPAPSSRAADAVSADHKIEFYSQWRLMGLRFLRHRAAVVSTVIIALLYLTAALAELIAPYDPARRFPAYSLAPPQRVRWIDVEGRRIGPYVHPYTQQLDPRTFARTYKEDTTKKVAIRLFARGDGYKLWGVIPGSVHLFGTEGTPVFLFGTDQLGRDLFTRVMYGGRISMSVGLIGVFISFVLGLGIGGASGYYGGSIDRWIQRLMEILRSFPQIPLWMALSAALPSSWSPLAVYFGITLILSVIGWTNLARVTRGKILSLRNEDFVTAARLMGAPERAIIWRHLIPSFMSHIIAAVTLAIPQMVLAETSLSFLGIGLRPPVISWGVLLQDGQNIHSLVLAPWLLIPGLFVIVFVLAYNFMGDGLRDAADPYK